ncbi:MAG: 5-dehydro-2-deoxygluconokinase [Naasia sp.]|jgi:5-dehydro-2-deoxygluconokinase|uniref:5-dehydro-2-deoxygluconokinase n=1 Tax=Naasia sp. TaxID=2546198 RepID=UPI00262A5BF9|nr:5-dehydro-2-deoxygluconokinase [Naasia sp.]MCU1569948.1 5-dehydro-2-deoxygluconokinase [Naasia sp.]
MGISAPTAENPIVVIGRIGVDLYPTEVNTALKDVSGFTKTIGGSAANVSVAIARHGHEVALVSRTGADQFGQFLVEQLERYRIQNRFVIPVAGMQSVLTFCEMFPPDHFPFYTYRNPTAPDMFVRIDDVPLDLVATTPLFWATATGLARQPSRDAHYAAWKARNRQGPTVLDLDYRPSFWDSAEEAAREIPRALEHVNIAVGNLDECEIAVGERDPQRAADALLDRGMDLAVVKMGPLGVLAKTRTETLEVRPIPVDVVNGLGAGDAFGGALVHGLVEGWPLARTLAFANAAGAIVATRFECSAAMPTTAEVLEMVHSVA